MLELFAGYHSQTIPHKRPILNNKSDKSTAEDIRVSISSPPLKYCIISHVISQVSNSKKSKSILNIVNNR